MRFSVIVPKVFWVYIILLGLFAVWRFQADGYFSLDLMVFVTGMLVLGKIRYLWLKKGK
jgi:hypothetical protein